VRAIDRETRRLDAIERGETPMPAAIPPSVTGPGSAATPRPKVSLPRTPTAAVPPPAAMPPSANAPVVSQQIAPLPPPIEIRPAPGVLRQPKLRPPLVLTPPPAAPPRPLF
jgi:hypothetical protein